MSNSLICCLMVVSVSGLPNVEISQGQRLYTGYKVFRAFPVSPQQRAALLRLEDGELRTLRSRSRVRE